MSFNLETKFPNLPGAPIREAVIDFRVELHAETTLKDLGAFPEGLDVQFPKRHERRSLQAQIEILKDAGSRIATPAERPDGYIFTAAEERFVVQARLDGFTLSRLPPYHDGDTFQIQARTFWDRYREIARPERVTRIAVRNINVIQITPGLDLQTYILTGPEIARSLPQTMLNFFMRLVVPDESGAVAVITETFGETDLDSNLIPLVFDIDASINVDLAPDSPELWKVLASLRAFKNRIFFNSLTPKALEAYR